MTDSQTQMVQSSGQRTPEAQKINLVVATDRLDYNFAGFYFHGSRGEAWTLPFSHSTIISGVRIFFYALDWSASQFRHYVSLSSRSKPFSIVLEKNQRADGNSYPVNLHKVYMSTKTNTFQFFIDFTQLDILKKIGGMTLAEIRFTKSPEKVFAALLMWCARMTQEANIDFLEPFISQFANFKDQGIILDSGVYWSEAKNILHSSVQQFERDMMVEGFLLTAFQNPGEFDIEREVLPEMTQDFFRRRLGLTPGYRPRTLYDDRMVSMLGDFIGVRLAQNRSLNILNSLFELKPQLATPGLDPTGSQSNFIDRLNSAILISTFSRQTFMNESIVTIILNESPFLVGEFGWQLQRLDLFLDLVFRLWTEKPDVITSQLQKIDNTLNTMVSQRMDDPRKYPDSMREAQAVGGVLAAGYDDSKADFLNMNGAMNLGLYLIQFVHRDNFNPVNAIVFCSKLNEAKGVNMVETFFRNLRDTRDIITLFLRLCDTQKKELNPKPIFDIVLTEIVFKAPMEAEHALPQLLDYASANSGISYKGICRAWGLSIGHLQEPPLPRLFLLIQDDEGARAVLDYILAYKQASGEKRRELSRINDCFTSKPELRHVYFVNYCKTAIKNYFDQYEDPEGEASSVIESMSQVLTGKWTEFFADPTSRAHPQLDTLRTAFAKMFETVAAGDVKTIIYLRVVNNGQQIAKLWQLIRNEPVETAVPSPQFKDLIQRLDDLRKLVNNICSECLDKDAFLDRFNVEKKEYLGQKARDVWNDARLREQLDNFRLVMTLYNNGMMELVNVDLISNIKDTGLKLRGLVGQIQNVLDQVRQEVADGNGKTLTTIAAAAGLTPKTFIKIVQMYPQIQEGQPQIIQEALSYVADSDTYRSFFELDNLFRNKLGFGVRRLSEDETLYEDGFRRPLEELNFAQLHDIRTRVYATAGAFGSHDNMLSLARDLAQFLSLENIYPFLKEKRGHMDQLQDSLADMADHGISLNHITDMDVVYRFVERWRSDVGAGDFRGIHAAFQALTTQKEFSDILDRFDRLTANFQPLKNFCMFAIQNSESRVNLAKDIIRKSAFRFKMADRKLMINVSKVANRDGLKTDYTFEQLAEIRDAIKMQLKLLSSDDANTESKDNADLLESFCELFELIEQLNRCSLEALNYGLPLPLPTDEVVIQTGIVEDFKTFVNGREVQLDGQLAELRAIYSHVKLATLLHGQLIPRALDALSAPIDRLKWESQHILSYLGFDKANTITTAHDIYQESMLRTKNQLTALRDTCQATWKTSRICVEPQSLPASKLNPSIVYFHQVSDSSGGELRSDGRRKDGWLSVMVNACLSGAGDFPRVHEILFCKKRTTQAEALAFLNRLFIWDTHQTFVIAFPERLGADAEDALIQQYSRLHTTPRKANLLLIYKDYTNLFVRVVMERSKVQKFDASLSPSEEALSQKFNMIREHTQIVVSEHAISGKTWACESMTSKDQASFVSIRLTGGLDLPSIYRNLLPSLDLKCTNPTFIHLDIGQVSPDSLSTLDELLFSMTIMRCWANESDVLTFPEQVRFIIELDSSKVQNLATELEFMQFPIGHQEISDVVITLQPLTPMCFFFTDWTTKKAWKKFDAAIVDKGTVALASPTDHVEAMRNIGLSRTAPVYKLPHTVSEPSIAQYLPQLRGLLGFTMENFRRREAIMFQKFLHFMATNFLRGGCFAPGVPDNEQTYPASAMTGVMLKSIEFFMNSSASFSIKQQGLNQAMSRLDKLNDNELKELEAETNKIVPSSFSGFWMTFFEGYPLFALETIDQVPRFLTAFPPIKQRLERIPLEDHNVYFRELAHSNNNLLNTLFCDAPTCCIVYYKDRCAECRSVMETPNTLAEAKAIQQVNAANKGKDPKVDPLEKVEDKLRAITPEQRLAAMREHIKAHYSDHEIACHQINFTNCDDAFCNNCLRVTPPFRNCPKCTAPLKSKENFEKKVVENVHISPEEQYLDLLAERHKKLYSLSNDNYRKLLAIYSRAKARLPVVLMGETGCGKTSLIRFLCNSLLCDYFELFSVHAGVTLAKFIERMRKFIKRCQADPSRDCWMIFDEFNTSEAGGLIKTIMIDRKMEGGDLPVNAIFVGTCNPFRLRTTAAKIDEEIGLRPTHANVANTRYKMSYMVNPVADSLLAHAFDFGQNSDAVERKYAQVMLKNCLKADECEKVSNAVISIHNFIKKEIDSTAVSLRDIKRFEKIVNFFQIDYFGVPTEASQVVTPNPPAGPAPAASPDQHVAPAPIPEVISILPQENIRNRIIVLSLLLCYYLRMPSEHTRNMVVEIAARELGLNKETVLTIYNVALDELLSPMKIDEGVVRTAALKENFFSMFVCAMSKVPLVIIGKPGSSKTLALDILFANAKGAQSTEPLFRRFPSLIKISYQGSEFSTSEGIENVFEKAEKYLNEIDQTKQIPVVVFDEIGLAELARGNPLKVLHSKLEFENIKVSFLAISNWRLDASKMNRALTVARRDPDVNDLQKTATDMVASRKNKEFKSRAVSSILKALATAYSLAKVKQAENGVEIFGLRDFFYMLKQVISRLTSKSIGEYKETGDPRFAVAVAAIFQNFSFEPAIAKAMLDKFTQEVKLSQDVKIRDDIPLPSAKQLIQANILDSYSRYLMIVADSPEVYPHIFQTIRQTLTKERRKRRMQVLVGSEFDDDKQSEPYLVDVVNKIIRYMEKPNVLVLHQLNPIYTSLYDLFNQGFKRQSEFSLCRVIQGSMSKAFFPVHRDFKIVLFITRAELMKADGPLVNRFEKVLITPESFKNPEIIALTKSIDKKLRDIMGDQRQEDEARRVFPNNSGPLAYKVQIIRNRLEGSLVEDDERDLTMEALMQHFVKTASMNFLSVIHGSSRLRGEIKKKFLTAFLDQKSVGLGRRLADTINGVNFACNKQVIYTYSDYSKSPLSECYDHQVLKEGALNSKIEELDLSKLRSEVPLKDRLDKFMAGKNSLLLIKMSAYSHAKHMYGLINHLQAQIQDNEEAQQTKSVVILAYYGEGLKGKSDNQSFYVPPTWDELFIDNFYAPLNHQFKKAMSDPTLNAVIDCYRSEVVKRIGDLADKATLQLLANSQDIDSASDQDLYRYSTFFKNCPQMITSHLVDVLMVAVKSDPKLKDVKNVFQFMKISRNLSTDFSKLVDRIKSSILDLAQEKLCRLLALLDNNGLISALTEDIIRRVPGRQDLWLATSRDIITVNAILSAKPELSRCPKLGFPFSHMEYKQLFPEDTPEFSNELLDNEPHKDQNFQNFCQKTVYRVFSKNLESFTKTDLADLLFDLVHLHLLKRKQIEFSLADIAKTFEALFPGKQREMLREYVNNPDLVCSYLMLFNHVMQILGDDGYKFFGDLTPQTTETVDPDSQGQPASFLQVMVALADNTFKMLSDKTILEKHGKMMVADFQRLMQLANILMDIVGKDFEYFPFLATFNKLWVLLSQANNPEKIIKSAIGYLPGKPLDILTEIEEFEKFVDSVSKASRRWNAGPLFARKLLEFQAYQYNKIYETLNLEDRDAHQKFLEIVLRKMEANPELGPFSNSLMGNILENTQMVDQWKSYVNLAEEKVRPNAHFELLNTLLDTFQKYLPNLLVHKLRQAIDLEENENPDQRLLESISSESREKAFTEVLFLKSDSKLDMTKIMAMVTVKMLIQLVSQEGVSDRLPLLANHFRSVTAQDKGPNRSLRLYYLKCLRKFRNMDVKEMKAECLKVNFGWVNEVFPEDHVVDYRLCVLTGKHQLIQDMFEKCDLQKSADQIGNRLPALLAELQNDPNPSVLLSFYSLIINEFYLEPNNMVQVTTAIKKNYDKLADQFEALLGRTGHSMVSKILAGFRFANLPNNAKNVSIGNVLFALACVLSQKKASNWFNQLVFDGDTERRDLVAHLKCKFLPGTILPEDKAILYMNNLDPTIPSKKGWICSETCKFVISFHNCGRPREVLMPDGKEVEIRCPLCNERFPHNSLPGNQGIPPTRKFLPIGEVQNFCANHIKNYKESVAPGFRSRLTIANENQDVVVVDNLTTKIYDFVTCSLGLGLIWFGNLSQAQLMELFGCADAEARLLGRVQMTADFLTATFMHIKDTPILINMILANLAERCPRVDSYENVQDHHQIELKTEAEVIKPLLSNVDNNLAEYQATISNLRADTPPQSVLIHLIQEQEPRFRDIYPLAELLPLSISYVPFMSISERIARDEITIKNRAPVVFHIFNNIEEIRNLFLIMKFKKFYDLFYQKWNGKLKREEDGKKSVFELIGVGAAADELKVAAREFIESWNLVFNKATNVRIGCQDVKVSPIDPSKGASFMLPSPGGDGRGTNILLGIQALIQVSNSLMTTANSKTQLMSSFKCGWKDLSEDTILKTSQKEFESWFNEVGVAAYCNYKDFGRYDLDLDRVEWQLRDRINGFRIFDESLRLVPPFNYAFESDQINEYINRLETSFKQEPMSQDDLTTLADKVAQLINDHKPRMISYIYNMLVHEGIPTILARRDVTGSTPLKDLKNLKADKEVAADIDPFLNYPVSKLRSLVLNMETNACRFLLLEATQRDSKLLTESTDPSWDKLKDARTNLKKASWWTDPALRKQVIEALMRFVLRSIYNNIDADQQLFYYLKNPTLFEINSSFDTTDEDLFGELSEFLVKHSLLLVQEMLTPKEEKKLADSGSLIRGNIFQTVDVGDRPIGGGNLKRARGKRVNE